MMLAYRRRPTPLHAARASVAAAYLLALLAAVNVLGHPIVLGAATLAIAGAALGARSIREVARAGRWALPFGFLVMLVNALVVRDGLTVIARLGDWGPLGQVDVTLEAVVHGATIGLRAALVVFLFALWSVSVDPDEILRAFRRVSYHSALSAALATRLVWVLQRDATRMAEAQRCRPGAPPSRVALLRATTAGALERAVDAAAALELRGFAGGRKAPRRRRPWSRHDLAFLASAVGMVALAVVVRVSGTAWFHSYPTVRLDSGVSPWIVSAALLALAWLPFADRRGVLR